jgi:hypothetical protein
MFKIASKIRPKYRMSLMHHVTEGDRVSSFPESRIPRNIITAANSAKVAMKHITKAIRNNTKYQM